MEEMIKYLRALVFLELEKQTGSAFAKPELLLEKSGFAHKEIAEILGKKIGAVSKTISRAKKSQNDGESTNE